MPESHPLRRITSAPAELKSMFSSGTESPKAVDWVRQTTADEKKVNAQEHQEIVASSSTSCQTDVLRNLVLGQDYRPDGRATASPRISGRDAFGAAHCLERECREHVDTSRTSRDGAIRRDPTSSEERPLTTRDLRRIEEGMGSTVRAELDRRDNRPHTWREWANSDWNTIVSTGGAGLGVLGVAAFVYTYRPDLIPHH